MTSEVEWRRRWKPDLDAFPWQPIRVDGNTYLLKYMFTTDSYKVLLTDLTNFWHEELAEQALQKRIKVDYGLITCKQLDYVYTCLIFKLYQVKMTDIAHPMFHS